MIYTIGEIVLDIIFKTLNDVKVKPGGSMLNTAISLGRLGVNVSHVSSIANDKASDLIMDFLHKNNINTSLINRVNSIKTSLALAYLNEKNDAEYTFYKSKLSDNEVFDFPTTTGNDIIHYGSFFSITPEVHSQIHKFLNSANSSKAIKIYDPNFRKPHLPDLQQLMPMIESNFKMADIVKGSNEDFENIYNIRNGAKAWELMQTFGVTILFYTKGEDGSELYIKSGYLDVATEKIDVESTIGAGDTYSAAIIYFLSKVLVGNKRLNHITIEQWEECVNTAHMFSRHTCQSFDNYISTDFCEHFMH